MLKKYTDCSSKKYSYPEKKKQYYETNKKKLIEKVQEYQCKTDYYSKITPEKKKIWARQAYINKKERAQKEKEQTIK